jgi:hypothetical protein
MRIKLITSVLFFASAFLSCNKEELSNTGSSGNTYLPILSKVLIDNQSVNEYSYTALNLISQEKSKYDFTVNTYNDKGLLVTSEYYGNDDLLSSDLKIFETAMNKNEWVTPENGKKVSIITYEYNTNGQLLKSTYSLPSSGSSEYSVFTYDNNNRISRQTMYWENAATGYIDYSYDGKKNLIKEILYSMQPNGTAELSTTTTYSFDSQLNPYKPTSRLLVPGINTNLNNIIKETYTIHLPSGQGPDKVQIYETSYVYNGMGYPVSKNNNVTYVYK